MTIAPGPNTQRVRPRFRTAHVDAVQALTPRMVRVTLGGDELTGFATLAPAQHIKVLFPQPDQNGLPVLAVPKFGPSGPIFPAGRPLARTYTPRRFDPTTTTIDIDFVIHGDGPGSNWAAAVTPGETVAIAGPRGGYPLDPDRCQYVLAGDESALPAIGTILDQLRPRDRAHVYVEVSDGSDEQPLESEARTNVTWIHRNDHPSAPGELLQRTLRSAYIPTDAALWVACEASAVRTIRHSLLSERNIGRHALHTRGYWKWGESDHRDHDPDDDHDE
jgi:NADPH-dependent ferric siderophore reductase